MICKGCGSERTIEDFPFQHSRETRHKVCKACLAQRVKNCQTENNLRDRELKLKTMKTLLAEIIEACEANNGRRLRLCIEKAKVEIKGFRIRKDVE